MCTLYIVYMCCPIKTGEETETRKKNERIDGSWKWSLPAPTGRNVFESSIHRVHAWQHKTRSKNPHSHICTRTGHRPPVNAPRIPYISATMADIWLFNFFFLFFFSFNSNYIAWLGCAHSFFVCVNIWWFYIPFEILRVKMKKFLAATSASARMNDYWDANDGMEEAKMERREFRTVLLLMLFFFFCIVIGSVGAQAAPTHIADVDRLHFIETIFFFVWNFGREWTLHDSNVICLGCCGSTQIYRLWFWCER